MPKLSIITINYNNAPGLRKTIESVITQTSEDFEYIVIDGASTDDSVNVIKEYDTQISYWISEPDTGIYNAMNKGIVKAKGEYCQFLNSGDCLATPNITEKMLADMPDCSFLTGDMQIMRNGKKVKWKGERMEEISFRTLYSGSINHSPTYIKTSLFSKYGLYDESLKIVSDWKFFIIAIVLNNEPIILKKLTVTNFDLEGISNINSSLKIQERKQVLQELIPNLILKDYKAFGKEYKKLQRINNNRFFANFFEITYRLLNKWDKVKRS